MEGEPKQEPSKNTEQIISLENFLAYNNPKLLQYAELIEKEKEDAKKISGYPQSAFSENLLDEFERFGKIHEKAFEYLRGKLTGKILVDVGGGSKEYMVKLAKMLGVKTYINVDIRPSHKGEIGEQLDPYKGIMRSQQTDGEKPMEVVYVDSDMLDFVARIKDGSSNFVLNGIDDYILHNHDYRQALREELIRGTEMEGILFGHGTDIWWPLDDERLKFVTKEIGLVSIDDPSHTAVCERVK